MNRTKSSCLKCNVYSACKYKQLQDGEYRSMFDLDTHAQNKKFVSNPYVQNVCHPAASICFSTKNGAGNCERVPTQIIGWDIQGRSISTRTTL